MTDTPITPAQTDALADSAIMRAAEAFLAALDAEPDKDCWDTETGEEEPGARRFSSDWALTDWHEARDAALANLRAALAAKPVKAAQTEALAKLAEIPPAGSEERKRWLEVAKRHYFTLWRETYTATPDQVLTLMSEARKQGQREALALIQTHQKSEEASRD